MIIEDVEPEIVTAFVRITPQVGDADNGLAGEGATWKFLLNERASCVASRKR
jgi:hypothetical protein